MSGLLDFAAVRLADPFYAAWAVWSMSSAQITQLSTAQTAYRQTETGA